jgi:hypothetical protein
LEPLVLSGHRHPICSSWRVDESKKKGARRDKLEDKTIFFSRKDSWYTLCIDAQLREALSKFTVRTNILCLVLIYDVFIVQYILTAPTKVKAELNIEKVRCVLFMIQILAISG